MHADALKCIKQKMRINLAVKGKKFCIFAADKHLLLYEFVFINCLNQLICPGRHSIVASNHTSDFIFSAFMTHRYKLFGIHAFKHFIQLRNTFCERMIQDMYKKEWQNRINQDQKQNTR